MILCAIGMTEIMLIALVVLLVFGGKKIPELMRGVGDGVRQFKKGLNAEDPVETEIKQSKEEIYAERLEKKRQQLLSEGVNPESHSVQVEEIELEHAKKTSIKSITEIEEQ